MCIRASVVGVDEVGAGIREFNREGHGIESVAVHLDVSAVVGTVRSCHRHEGAGCLVVTIVLLYFVLNRQIRNPVAFAVAETVFKSRNVKFKVAVIVLRFIAACHINGLEVNGIQVKKLFFHTGKDLDLSKSKVLFLSCIIRLAFFGGRSRACCACSGIAV